LHNNLGTALMGMGRLDEAAAHFEAALKLDPTLATAHMNLSLVLRKQGKFNEALEHAEKAQELASPLRKR